VSRSSAPRPFVIIGNPENRRVTLFQEALAEQNLPAATVISWLSILESPDGDPFRDLPRKQSAILRIDSFGENFDVTRLLLHRGYEDAEAAGVWALSPREVDALPYDRGRIVAPKQEHLGFLRVLDGLAKAIEARPELEAMPTPKGIELLFDKVACSHAFAGAGVRIPPALHGVTSSDELRERMEREGITRVFVKLTCGSSASCLALFHHDPSARDKARRMWLFTSMEIEGERFYNSLKPRRYESRAAIDRILGFLFREGSHVEEHVAKARIRGRYFDTRMVAIGGEPTFTVVRKSVHPITNLHLGGERGTIDELEAAVSAEALATAHDDVRKVAALHDGLHVGVDVMFTEDGDDHRVLEANAFGDLLPNLTRDGLSVYAWEIRTALGAASSSAESKPRARSRS